MRYKFILMAVFALTLVSSSAVFSQNESREIKILVLPAPPNATETVAANGRRISLTIKNVSEKTVSVGNYKIYMKGVEEPASGENLRPPELTGDMDFSTLIRNPGTVRPSKPLTVPTFESDREKCFHVACASAFVASGIRKLKPQESVTVDVDLSLLHWDSDTPVSVYVPKNTKNLNSVLKPDDYRLTVGVRLYSNQPELKNKFVWIVSEPHQIRLSKEWLK